jgi:hypothetical protein
MVVGGLTRAASSLRQICAELEVLIVVLFYPCRDRLVVLTSGKLAMLRRTQSMPISLIYWPMERGKYLPMRQPRMLIIALISWICSSIKKQGYFRSTRLNQPPENLTQKELRPSFPLVHYPSIISSLTDH